ncbi:MAG: carbohydrate ABC transporter permease [Anaerolineales bacterium]|nr:carbohydrate ABC transporter permease [Anaerolineales bacterium]
MTRSGEREAGSERRLSRPALRATLYYLLLAAVALPFLLPLLWMVVTAFKPAAQIYGAPLALLPDPPTTENFTTAWGLLDFPAFLRNSLVVTGFSMLGTVLSSSLVGFAFATLPARGKETLFVLLLATVMLPASATLIPLFILFSQLGWVNSYLPLIVPQFFANAFYVFLFRQFFRGLSVELFESAELDGCNPLQAYWRIAMPLARPVLATVAVFSFVGSWNDFLGPLIYLNSTGKFTLSLGLSLFHGLFYTQLQYLMPMSLVAVLPVLGLFWVAQRYLMNGVVVDSPA